MNKIVFALLIGSCTVQAAENLKFHGTLVTGPVCTISNNETIEVNFNNVLIDKIDGNNYVQNVPYEITCDSTARDASMAMTLTLSGTQTAYNTAAIDTDISGLGIELRHDGLPFTIGSVITINEQAKPVLTAAPVKQSGVVLTEGAFAAWATLQVDYQ